MDALRTTSTPTDPDPRGMLSILQSESLHPGPELGGHYTEQGGMGRGAGRAAGSHSEHKRDEEARCASPGHRLHTSC